MTDDEFDYGDLPDDPRLEPWRRECRRQQRHEPLTSKPERHHFVPEVYLGRFGKVPDDSGRKRHRSNPKPSVTRVDLVTGEVKPSINVRHAAAETNLYTVESEEPSEVEHLLGVFESCVGYAFKNLDDDPQYFPDDIDRRALAHFIALQYVRGPATKRKVARNQTTLIREIMLRTADEPELVRAQLAKEGEDTSDEAVAERIEALRAVAPMTVMPEHQNEAALAILNGSVDLMPAIANRRWVIARTEVPLLTTDEPVVLLDPRSGSWFPIDVESTRTVAFALDPRRLLLMHLDEVREGIAEASPELGRRFNSIAVKLARRWIFHHPDDSALEGVSLDRRSP